MSNPPDAQEALTEAHLSFLRKLAYSVSGSSQVGTNLPEAVTTLLASRGLVEIAGGRAFITGHGMLAVENVLNRGAAGDTIASGARRL